jgi:electron transport complex protein RnfC
MKHKLWHFPGGLHLNGHKHMSMTEHVAPISLPAQVVLPLQQHIGEPAEPIIKVRERVLKGQMIARASEYVSVPVHASTSGQVIAIEERIVPHPSGLPATCIVIEADGKDEWTELKPITDYQNMDPSALRNVIRDAGIVGLGGAGFPSFIKLNPGPTNVVETLILNGAECEPYITCDAMLMQEHPRRIIDGLLVMKHALRAKHCIIAVEDNKKVAHTMLVNALHEHESEFIEIVQIPTIYPTGGEKQLIKVLTGMEIPSHGLPIDIGIVCHNVATAATVCETIEQGKPLISRNVTVTGDAVETPRNLEVLIGTPFAHLLDACGWQKEQTDEVLMGGPMMGFCITSLDAPVIKTTNCILARPKDQPHRQPAMPCIRCGQCANVCPAKLLPQQLYWYSRAKDFDKTQDYNLFDCIECGCCAYVCPSHIPLVQYYRFAKTEIWAMERDKKKADHARQRHEFHQYRLERKQKEDEERKRMKKELLKKTQGKENAESDTKKTAIEAALARVKAKREQQEKKNVENLTEQQKQAIRDIEERRQRLRDAESSNEENN